MMAKIAELLKELADRPDEAAAGCDECLAIVRRGRALYSEMSQFMDIHVFGMTDISGMADLSGKPEHYDVVVSIKTDQGEIHELDEIEGLTLDQVEGALQTLATRYPHATVHPLSEE